MDRIKKEILEKIIDNTWMDKETRQGAVNRTLQVKYQIGGWDRMLDGENYDRLLGLDKVYVIFLNNLIKSICSSPSNPITLWKCSLKYRDFKKIENLLKFTQENRKTTTTI